MRLVLRPQKPGESETLSALALRSKAVWGYDAAFMAACVDELRVSPDDPVIVAEENGNLLAFACVSCVPPLADLDTLYVDPPHMGRGIGRVLFNACATRARDAGATHLRIEADPHATPFYVTMGAKEIGRTPSGSIAGRFLPLMELAL